jgi:hypothetical protein
VCVCVCECRQYKFPAFQAGPRVCLGRNMAMLEAKMCISVLLKHFDFKFADGFKMMYKSRSVLVGWGGATHEIMLAFCEYFYEVSAFLPYLLAYCPHVSMIHCITSVTLPAANGLMLHVTPRKFA